MTPLHIKDYIKDVVGICEANSYERLCLWQEHKNYWEETLSGYGLVVGKLNNRPTFLSLLVDKIKGKKILFYYPTSQLVDYKLIDKWLIENFKLLIENRMKSDAMNFNNIVNKL